MRVTLRGEHVALASLFPKVIPKRMLKFPLRSQVDAGGVGLNLTVNRIEYFHGPIIMRALAANIGNDTWQLIKHILIILTQKFALLA